MTGRILRLYPLPEPAFPAEGIHEDLELPPERLRDPSRPYVIINMVSSVDGRTTIQGKGSRIGSETDRRVMRTLRSGADAVMIGAGTLRAEKLSLGLDDSSIPQPLAVIATSTGELPLENLIVGESQEVLVITTQAAPEDLEERFSEIAHLLRVSATPSGTINLVEAFEILKTKRAIELLLVEGGPRLNHSLISSGLADELFLTLAPKLLGGGTMVESPTILNGPTLAGFGVKLLSAHLVDDELFLRYFLRQKT